MEASPRFSQPDGAFLESSPHAFLENPAPGVRLRHPSSPTTVEQKSVDVMDEKPSVTPEKIKKKKHFRVFNRKKRNALEKHHSEDSSNGADTAHLALNSSWGAQGAWNRLDPEKSISLHSSNLSLLSVESDEGRELTDEEMVESLVNPKGRMSASPPLEYNITMREIEGGGEGGAMDYTVNITLMSGHGLAVRDRSGTSDPYVKFKCPPFKYRSQMIPRNLNPEWKEHFSFRTNDLNSPMIVRVYDHDYGSLDDFMGGQTLDFSAYAIDTQHIVDLGLEDPAVKNEALGFIRIFLKVTPVTEVEFATSQELDKKQKSASSKVWKSVLSVTLLEGKNLPAMDHNGLSDPYCKFKLGSQKFKSSSQSKTLDPKWMQRFDLRMFEDCFTLHIEVWDKDFPQNDDFIGLCSVDLQTLQSDVAHDFTLPLLTKNNELANDDCTIHFNLCITATRVEEEEDKEEVEKQMASNKYGLLRSLDIKAIKERNVGHLCLTINEVVDLVPCNSFVLVELGHSCVKTQPVFKSGNPVWNKTFEFTVGDIHDELEIKVYKMGSRSDHLLGKVNIPLHRLKQGSQQFALKDKDCMTRSRGIIHIDTGFVYNPVRAMIRTVNPKEVKLLEAEQKFKRKLLMDNIKRVSNLTSTVLSTAEFVESTWSWQNKTLSAISFLIFLVVTLFGELWMVFFGCVVIFAYQYLVLFIRNEHEWQRKVSSNVHMVSNLSNLTPSVSVDHDDSDFSDGVEDKHSSLRDRFRQFQEILVLVQTILGRVADAEEGIRNLLNWRVPFLSTMAILVFLGGTVLFYTVPIRYVILIWGINKYTKRLRKPNFISNNELLDFLSRCPTNKQLHQWAQVPLTIYQKPSDTKTVKKRSIKKR